jgi:hypothetical protein
MLALVALAVFVKPGDQFLAVSLLTTAIGINSATYLGFQVLILNKNFIKVHYKLFVFQ